MEKKSNLRRNFLIIFWSLFLVGIFSVFMLFVSINKGWIGYLPPLDELQNPRNNYATEIFSADMEILGRFFIGNDNRVGVSYNQISPNVINALIATEDERFYGHSGVDARALARAIILTGILQQKGAGGGSTISQQLAKLLYSPASATWLNRIMQKPIEWVIAVKLEKLYSKEEIITMYLNQFDFLHNAVGIKSAAQVYFNTTPDKLNIQQAAMLVGMAQNPSRFNPVRREELTTNRRNVVLGQMLRADQITRAEFDSLKMLPLNLNFRRIDHNEGLAPYFREYLRRTMTAREPRLPNSPTAWQREQYADARHQWDNNPLYGFVHKNRKADGSSYNIYTDGLKIYTTIDSRMQRYAEEAVNEHIKTLQDQFFRNKRNSRNAPFSRNVSQEEITNSLNRAKRQSDRYRNLQADKKTDAEIDAIFATPIEMSVFSYHGAIDTIMSPMDSIRYHKFFLRTAIMSMDPRNGHVKAYVGGPNYNQFKFDMVSQGRRQIGSTVKPFLYTLAMEELGMSPCDEVVSQPVTIVDEVGRPWTPRNQSNTPIGTVITLRRALAESNNFITAYLMSLTTPQRFANLLRSFGITGQIDAVYALALGVNEVSLQEMVAAYTAFPNKGIRFEPILVTRIDDANGNTIVNFVPQSTEVFSELASYKMVSMMQSAVDGGTSGRLRFRFGLRGQIGGKTGTTQNHSDGWFMGFTPTLVSGVWTGGEDRSIHFDNISDGQGAQMALPIWALYMQKVLNDPTLEYSVNDRFDFPSWFDPNAGCR
jgi:penicillin-binding protein 1A